MCEPLLVGRDRAGERLVRAQLGQEVQGVQAEPVGDVLGDHAAPPGVPEG